MSRTLIRTAGTLAIAASIAACSDAGSPSTTAQVNFNLATKAATAPAAAARSTSFATVGTPETFTDGTNTLVIDEVQLVLREIELKRADSTAAGCDDSSSDDSPSHDDDCEKLEVGPVLLDLPLGGTGGAARSFSVEVAAGTYREIEFEIHKPSHDEDAAFVQANPDFAGVSVKVTGTYNGATFSFTSDLNAKEEIELSPPLVTAESAATDVTLFVDLDQWFRNGTSLVDPSSANAGGANEQLVENNIKGQLRAFEDENEDGDDDHGGDNHGGSGHGGGLDD